MRHVKHDNIMQTRFTLTEEDEVFQAFYDVIGLTRGALALAKDDQVALHNLAKYMIYGSVYPEAKRFDDFEALVKRAELPEMNLKRKLSSVKGKFGKHLRDSYYKINQAKSPDEKLAMIKKLTEKRAASNARHLERLGLTQTDVETLINWKPVTHNQLKTNLQKQLDEAKVEISTEVETSIDIVLDHIKKMARSHDAFEVRMKAEVAQLQNVNAYLRRKIEEMETVQMKPQPSAKVIDIRQRMKGGINE